MALYLAAGRPDVLSVQRATTAILQAVAASDTELGRGLLVLPLGRYPGLHVEDTVGEGDETQIVASRRNVAAWLLGEAQE